jgi:hypothetical protein
VLEFFAASVGFVLGNLAARLLNDVEIPEMNFLAKLLRTFCYFFKTWLRVCSCSTCICIVF